MTFGSTFGRTFSPSFQPKSQAAAAAGVWTPNSITGCSLWFDFSDADTMFTDAGSTKVANDGDLIYQINDKSGNSVNATQTTAGARPAYKTNILNSKSAGYSAASGTYYMSHAYPLGTATDFTIFVAAKYIENTTSYPGVFGANWGAPTMHIGTSWQIYIGTDAPNRIITANNYIAANTNFLLTFKKSGTSAVNLSVFKNADAAVVNTGKTAANPTSRGMVIFSYFAATYAMKGYIYEYIIYNTALSDTDKATVITYLNNKWAIY